MRKLVDFAPESGYTNVRSERLFGKKANQQSPKGTTAVLDGHLVGDNLALLLRRDDVHYLLVNGEESLLPSPLTPEALETVAWAAWVEDYSEESLDFRRSQERDLTIRAEHSALYGVVEPEVLNLAVRAKALHTNRKK